MVEPAEVDAAIFAYYARGREKARLDGVLALQIGVVGIGGSGDAPVRHDEIASMDGSAPNRGGRSSVK